MLYIQSQFFRCCSEGLKDLQHFQVSPSSVQRVMPRCPHAGPSLPLYCEFKQVLRLLGSSDVLTFGLRDVLLGLVEL
jgi:hypothetical protein